MLHNSQKDFLKRHIGPSDEDQNKMLKKLNYKSLDYLIKSTHYYTIWALIMHTLYAFNLIKSTNII